MCSRMVRKMIKENRFENIGETGKAKAYLNADETYIDILVHRADDVKIGRWKKYKTSHGKYQARNIEIKMADGTQVNISIFRD